MSSITQQGPFKEAKFRSELSLQVGSQQFEVVDSVTKFPAKTVVNGEEIEDSMFGEIHCSGEAPQLNTEDIFLIHENLKSRLCSCEVIEVSEEGRWGLRFEYTLFKWSFVDRIR